MNKHQYLAEIIESSLSDWTGVCWKWDQAPTFGSLVTTTTDDITTYGIVFDIKTGSNDPIRTPAAYQKTHQELLRDQPQIFAFLQTTFQCITVGYTNSAGTMYHLPQLPPRLHAFIAPANAQQYHDFFKNEQFLHMLFHKASSINNFEELLLAIIKNLKTQKIISDEKLMKLVETFSILSNNDYQKLKLFLHRMQNVIS